MPACRLQSKQTVEDFNTRFNPLRPVPHPLAPSTGSLRDPFPHLRQCVYLDTAAVGLTWQGHGAAVARFYDEVKSRGHDARPEWLAMTRRVRERLAAWLGVTPADVTFVSNTTEALNHVAIGLRLSAGDRVVLAADEFPSVVRPWAHAQEAGAQIAHVPVADEAARSSALRDALDDRTRVLAVSHTHSGTGTTLALAPLAAACRANDALLVVDGIQALGAVPVDLAGVDVYAAAFFKWMLSGFGIGVLVTSARGRARMRPVFLGYANEADPNELQYAHVNIPAMYGLDATLDFLEHVGWPTIHARVRELGVHLVAGARARGLDLVTPPDACAGIYVLRCADGEGVARALGERGIRVSPRGAGIRLSPHYYNTPEEVDACLDAYALLAAPRG